jgi:hypothetical protein
VVSSGGQHPGGVEGGDDLISGTGLDSDRPVWPVWMSTNLTPAAVSISRLRCQTGCGHSRMPTIGAMINGLSAGVIPGSACSMIRVSVRGTGRQDHGGRVLLARHVHPGQPQHVSGMVAGEQGGECSGGVNRRGVQRHDGVPRGQPRLFRR